MAPFSVGDRFQVIADDAPFYGQTGVVTDVEEGSPWPVVGVVSHDGTKDKCAFKLSEIKPLMGEAPRIHLQVMAK